MKAHNKYYQLLIDELETEILRNRNYKDKLILEGRKDKSTIKICEDYINYHQDIISFIERFDKKVYENEKRPSSDN